MFFKTINPSPRMRQFIESFWSMELDCGQAPDGFFERVLPDGHSEIIFHFAERVFQVSGNERLTREPKCFLIGQNTQPYKIAARGRVKMFGIKFNPFGASFLLREHASQFTDTFVDLSSVWGDAVEALYQRLGESEDLKTGISEVENFLSGFCPDTKTMRFAYLDFAIRRIRHEKGNTGLSALAAKLGVTNRHLEKLFLAHVGVQPKIYAQIVRLQEGLRLISSGEKYSLTEVAAACGYFDQSHFIRAFKRFAGVTPADLRREKLIMQKPFFGSSSNSSHLSNFSGNETGYF